MKITCFDLLSATFRHISKQCLGRNEYENNSKGSTLRVVVVSVDSEQETIILVM